MAHTYYGSDGLILTSISRQNFDSGLSRVDCIYKCITTRADAFAPILTAGSRVPDRTDFVIRENASRKDETDGFTTFTVSGFYGTLQTTTDGSASIPSVLGIARTSISLQTIRTIAIANTPSDFTTDYTIETLSDTFTQTFTVNASASCLDLVAPTQVLNLKLQTDVTGIESILKQGYSYTEPTISTTYVYRSLYVSGTIAQSLSGKKILINVNRSNFGIYDEITATWGLDIEDITITVPYALSQTRVFT